MTRGQRFSRVRLRRCNLATAACFDDGEVRICHSHVQKTRQVMAELQVYASVDEVWRVLTDYDRLATFVPNLAQCERVGGAPPGRIWIRQRGCSQATLWRLEASALLEVQERVLPAGAREVRFTQVEGDFKEFSGRWVVEPCAPGVPGGPSLATNLRYEIAAVPQLSISSALVAYVLRCGLPANLTAIARRAEQMAQRHASAPKFAARAFGDEPVQLPIQQPQPQQQQGEEAGAEETEALPPKASAWPWQRAKISPPRLAAGTPAQYLGAVSVPLPPAAPLPTAELSQQAVAPDPRPAARAQLQALYPPFAVGARQPAVASHSPPAVSEVHLRRLDRDNILHRRAVAEILIDASPQEVWAVLTDYDALADFIPALAVSERLQHPSGDANLVRLRQVGFKAMAYVMLHGEATLDLLEIAPRELQFRQVPGLAGDFLQLQGKFMLVSDEPQPQVAEAAGLSSHPGNGRTVLRYAVEVVLPRAARLLGMLEPALERVVYQDIPANLLALKHRVETRRAALKVAELEQQGEHTRAEYWRRQVERPRPDALKADLRLLCDELRACFGDLGCFPTRSELRAALRTDLEKAIAAHGGQGVVAAALGWPLKARHRRPKGYWDDLVNVRAAIDEFIAEQGMEAGVMPLKNDFVRANRLYLAKVVERWGGLPQLAELLEYQLASEGRGSVEWRAHIAEVAKQNPGISGKMGLFELAAKTYKPKQQRRQQQSVGGKRRPGVTGTIEFLDAPPSDSAATLQLQARLASEAPDRFPAAATNALSDRFPATAASAMSMLTRSSRQGGGSSSGSTRNGSGSSSSSGSGVEMAPDLYGMPAPGARGRRPRQQPSSSDEDMPERTKKRPGQLRRARREIDSW